VPREAGSPTHSTTIAYLGLHKPVNAPGQQGETFNADAARKCGIGADFTQIWLFTKVFWFGVKWKRRLAG
jgi:hypothetical protein